MIANVGKILFARERVAKFKKLTTITFLIGIIILIIFPFLCNNIFIVEKQMKNSSNYDLFMKQDKFQKNLENFKELFKNFKQENKENNKEDNKENFYSKFLKKLLKENFKNLKNNNISPFIISEENFLINKKNEKIFNLRINSQRGDFSKAIVINFLYNKNKSPEENCFELIFSFAKNFDTKNYYTWLARDLLINFLPSDLFYSQKFSEIFLQKEFFNSLHSNYFINLDLGDLKFSQKEFSEKNLKLILGINGIHSENLDMDYYKNFHDNFIKINSSNYFDIDLQTFENELIKGEMFKNFGYYINKGKKEVINLIKNISLINKQSVYNIINSPIYKNLENFYKFMFNNIAENYLFINDKSLDNDNNINNQKEKEIDLNKILITQGRLSILVKFKKFENLNKENNYKDLRRYQKIFENYYFNIFGVMERVIKVLSKCELDAMRGEKNYILISPDKFQGSLNILVIPVLCVLIIFFELLDKIYKNNEMIREINELNFEKNEKFVKKEINNLLANDKLRIFMLLQGFCLLMIFLSFFFEDFLIILNLKDSWDKYLEKNLRIFEINVSNLKNFNHQEISFLIKCFILLLLILLYSLAEKILDFKAKKNLREILNSENTQKNPIAVNIQINKVNELRENANKFYYEMIITFYLGINLFVIFFLNYGISLLFIGFVLIPQFFIIFINNSFLFSSEKINKNLLVKLQKILDLLITFSSFYILLYFLDFEINSLSEYFNKIFESKFGYYDTLKFIYLDIIIFYAMKVHNLLSN